MTYLQSYDAPPGRLLMAAEDHGLTGLWFDDQAHVALRPREVCVRAEHPILTQTARWLDEYFAGREPSFCPPLCLYGTNFQREVWEILRAIPYGHTVTYGQIAIILAKRHGLRRMSAQAVGGAVGRNPVAILVPCHRVIGAGGRLTGYAGGLDRKLALLKLEGVQDTFPV